MIVFFVLLTNFYLFPSCCRILSALKTRSTRSRTLFHDVPPNEILDVLADFGILPNMLPTDMGGTLRLDQQEWIANRWATE